MPSRRFFVGLTALFSVGGLWWPLRVLAAWNEPAFGATSEADALQHFFGAEPVSPSPDITIEAHDLVENGAYVPVRIEARLPEVRSITILVENNPNPLIANFELGPGCRPVIATRIKVGAPSAVVAVVRSGGKLFSTRKFVEVVEGGCS